MTEPSRSAQDRSPVPADWTYAPAPESTDIVQLQERYGLFVGGEWLEREASTSRRSRRATRSRSPRSRRRAEADVARRGRRRARGVRDAGRSCPARERVEVPVPDRAHPRRALARVRGAREPERRQADQGVARRRPAARGRALLLLRRLGRQARVRVPEPLAEAARRRGPDHPVELPAADAGVEDRAGARRRQHGRAEAGRDDAADRAALLRRAAPGRAAAGRRQHRHRRRPRRRRARRRRGRQDRVHRLDRGRQGDPAPPRGHRQEADARARRQGREHRLRRRGARPGGRGDRQRHLLQPGPRLLRRLAALRAGVDLRAGDREAEAAHGDAARRRPARQEHRRRRDQLAHAAREDQGARRGRARTRAPRSTSRRAGCPRRATGSRRPSSRTSRRATASRRRRSSARCSACSRSARRTRRSRRRTTRRTGSSAGVWTEKGSRILWMAERLRAGVVWANTFNRFDPTSPFGGYKESGFGREGGLHGLEPYLDFA